MGVGIFTCWYKSRYHITGDDNIMAKAKKILNVFAYSNSKNKSDRN